MRQTIWNLTQLRWIFRQPSVVVVLQRRPLTFWRSNLEGRALSFAREKQHILMQRRHESLEIQHLAAYCIRVGVGGIGSAVSLSSKRIQGTGCWGPHDCDCKLEDVLVERDGVQVRLNATASHLFGVRSSLTLGCERLERQSGRLAACLLLLGSFLWFMASALLEGLLAWSVTKWLLPVHGYLVRSQ